jgi:hypothetical protein
MFSNSGAYFFGVRRKLMDEQKCENCGNLYDKSIQIIREEESHYFDSFECAINFMAPRCSHCETRIIGHGVEESGKIYCCANCATHNGTTALRDRVL